MAWLTAARARSRWPWSVTVPIAPAAPHGRANRPCRVRVVGNLAGAHPAVCELITLPNRTVEGRTSHALRLGGGAAGSRPVVMAIGDTHSYSEDILFNWAVRGKAYTPKSGYHLYPTAGTSDDYVYSRCFNDPGQGKVCGFTIEWGKAFHPPWAEMKLIVADISAGLAEFCLAAQEVTSP